MIVLEYPDGGFDLPRGGRGEDPESSSLAHAERWAIFYRELVNVETEVLGRMEQLAAGKPDDVRAAVQTSNIDPMEELIREFQQRLDFWEQRAGELKP